MPVGRTLAYDPDGPLGAVIPRGCSVSGPDVCVGFSAVRIFCLSVSNGQCNMPDMKALELRNLERYLDRLRELPFVKRAKVREVRRGEGADVILRITMPRGTHELLAEVKRTHLTYALVDGVLAQTRQAFRRPWILFAPYVGPDMGRYLSDLNVNYADLVGNCRVRIGDQYAAVIEGKKRAREPLAQSMRAPGYQVLFAVLAKPELLNDPVRTLAEAAGTGKTAAADALARLREEGLIGFGERRRHLLDPGTLLDRWVAGYATVVRPRLLVGRYRTSDVNPEALEERVEKAIGDTATWAWGGGAAAMRLTKLYRGEETVLHVDVPPGDLVKRLRALPAEDGPLTILRVPGRIALEGALPRTAHPLLVYTELLTARSARAREAAQEIQERYLRLRP